MALAHYFGASRSPVAIPGQQKGIGFGLCDLRLFSGPRQRSRLLWALREACLWCRRRERLSHADDMHGGQGYGGSGGGNAGPRLPRADVNKSTFVATRFLTICISIASTTDRPSEGTDTTHTAFTQHGPSNRPGAPARARTARPFDTQHFRTHPERRFAKHPLAVQALFER